MICGTWIRTGCESEITCEACCCCGAHCACLEDPGEDSKFERVWDEKFAAGERDYYDPVRSREALSCRVLEAHGERGVWSDVAQTVVTQAVANILKGRCTKVRRVGGKFARRAA